MKLHDTNRHEKSSHSGRMGRYKKFNVLSIWNLNKRGMKCKQEIESRIPIAKEGFRTEGWKMGLGKTGKMYSQYMVTVNLTWV